MTQSPVNIHRSFAGLLVGNLLAILASGIACILIWQSLFPDFYQQLRQHLDEQKQVKESDPPANKKPDEDRKPDPQKPGDAQKTGQEKNKEGAANDKQDVDPAGAKKKVTPIPEFSLMIWATTLMTDILFAAAAGFVCVLIAGFARNNHGVLMALFILVWKFQQLVGFVENQLPPSLILAEVIGLPIACLFGASMVKLEEQDSGPEDPGDQEIHGDETE